MQLRIAYPSNETIQQCPKAATNDGTNCDRIEMQPLMLECWTLHHLQNYASLKSNKL